jgi:hypothetical protein
MEAITTMSSAHLICEYVIYLFMVYLEMLPIAQITHGLE